jgi:hypothetical protein
MRKRKPKGYWTKERCREEALKYNTRSEFKKRNEGVYKKIQTEGWFDELCGHMIDLYKHWTKEDCKEEALKYNTRDELKRGNGGAYSKSIREGWLDEICEHMVCGKLKWTYEICKKEALKYNTRSEFKKGSSGAYAAASKNGWLNELFNNKIGFGIKWCYDRCLEVSLECKTRTEFNKNYPGAYNRSYTEGWLDDICGHMESQGSLKDRYVYDYLFHKYKTSYTGLTWNLEERHYSHMNDPKSSVFRFMGKHDLTEDDFEYVIHGYYDKDTAVEIETQKEEEHRSNGWNTLNSIKTGGLGGKLKWTYERCKKEALKYNTRTEFHKGSASVYVAVRKNGWLDEICGHMKITRKPKGYWTYEKCKSVAMECKTRSELQKNHNTIYQISKRNGWLDEICKHMDCGMIYWTYERCKKEALKYNTRSEFRKGSSGSYQKSSREKWLDEICGHMKITRKPAGYWTKERCKEEAKKYNTRNEFRKGSSGAYQKSIDKGWLDEFFPK